MELKINNKLETNYEKALSTVSYFSKARFSKFPKSKTWNLEFWIDENNPSSNLGISCGIALKRPDKKTLYVKKKAKSLNMAIKRCLEVLENTMKREPHRRRFVS